MTQKNIIEKENIKDFEISINEAIEYGASNEEALKWLIGSDFHDNKVYTLQDIERYVYNLGFLNTDYGRQLIRRMECVVTQCIILEKV